ncbi:uncharacterized protein [Setaria viridis]|uniref:uncharacterized protein isoform X2 n=1 Tax=Setaria viridis TaxID=4556 RepID=UPI003B3A9701
MPAGDNPHSISEKKAALRESPKRTKNVVNEQPGTSFSKDKVAATVGLKRPQPYGPLSPTNHHTLGNPGANGHLVYVRRRPDTDQSKGGTSARAESSSSISTKKPVAGGSQPQESSLKHQNNVPHTQSSPQFASPAAAPNRAHPPRSSNQDRSDRFLRLQTFLRNNEQSGQEEYIRMLRSLSSVGLSKHAIELEKRAANLLVEEGKELQKMKVLNVLGKLSPTDAPQFPAQPATVKHLPFPARR